MQRLNRLNQARNDRPLPVGSGHSPYDRPDPPKSWEPGWQLPVIDAASPEHQERLLAWAIVNYWKPIEEIAHDSH